VPRASNRCQDGMGIGLAMVCNLVEMMHGGSVHAFSDGKGQGSQFVVRLPRTVQAAQHDGTPQGETP